MMDGKENSMAPRRFTAALIGAGLLALGLALAFFLWPRGESADSKQRQAKEEHAGEAHKEGTVELSAEALAAAKIETALVTERQAGALLRVTGTVEANQQQVQQVTPLVAGRVARVYAALGERVRAGAPVAVISSPQIAEMHGKLHEAETRLEAAERNLARVQKAENRAAVLAAKARLDEAEATLRRTRRLVELGAGAGKDLLAAETVHKTAQAEYEFQSNIALNKELAEARAEVDTARVDVQHIRDGLRAFGAPVAADEQDHHQRDTSLVILRAPAVGMITERLVNAGAGVEAGKPLFTIANIATVWVIANVPEAQMSGLRNGTPAVVRGAALGEQVIAGRVTYIGAALNEETRTAPVRIEVANPQERLKIGMFVEVGLQVGAGAKDARESELVIPDEAVQRNGERSIVFVPRAGEAGHFEVREIEIGGVSDGLRRVISGLQAGERVVTKGSFTLKTQLMKGELGEEH